MTMRSRLCTKILLAAIAASVAPTALPGEALATHRESPVDVVATISVCRGESLTIAAQTEPARDAKPRALRAVRRAQLQLRFEAAPLVGPSRKSRKFKLGRTVDARRSARFADLPAQSYGGVVHYKWKRGKRTVVAGFVRTRKAKVAGRRGKAFCSLRFGRRPTDTTPPVIAPVPSDSGWKRGPLQVRFFVFDDLSGVALVVSRVDGGPFVRGRATTISGEGEHRLEYIARDAAGNQTPVRAVTLRVDETAPTAPVVTAPSGTTTDPTPEIRWDASSDAASGVAGYVVLVRDAGGAIVWSHTVRSGQLAVTVGQQLTPGDYTAEVVAFDGAAPRPFTSTGSSAFTVVAPPTPPPDSDGDGVDDASDNCPSTANADQVNFDADSQGDACDGDDDNDGLADGPDPNDNATDSDGDGVADGAEAGRGTSPSDTDSDDDGFNDLEDDCPAQPESGFDLEPEGCP